MTKVVMNDRIEHMVAHYISQYESRVPEPSPKFPTPLNGEEEMKAKMMAAFRLRVEKLGGHVNWDLETMSCIENIVNWMFDQNKRWLILSGTMGTGKTTMIKSIRTVFSSSVYYHAKCIFDEFKMKESLPDIPYNKPLLLDDMGEEPLVCKIYGEDHAPITDLLLRRYDKRATTVIATNLTIDEIQKRYGDRLADRIVEISAHIFNDAPSYRGR